MKRTIVFLLVFVLCLSMFAATVLAEEGEEQEAPLPAGGPLELTVVTSYGSEDANRANFEKACVSWQQGTGNTVNDTSAMPSEEWKAQVKSSFESGNEPDVLYYFSGRDADDIVSSGKVVSLGEIKAEYPNYAANMNASRLPGSTADGQNYVVPVNGAWASMYINPVILEECGVMMPDGNYAWEQFLEDCQKIKDAGYVPIAASLLEAPDYWCEFMIMNHGSAKNHSEIPKSALDDAGKKWIAGLNDIKTLYDMGFFPQDTLTIMENEAAQLMYGDRAAFMIGGEGQIEAFRQNVPERMNDFAVSYVPGAEERRASDIISEISMGYYITRKAWEDSAKRDAAVSFVDWMTRDDTVKLFSTTQITALKDGRLMSPLESNNLIDTALAVTGSATEAVQAIQAYITPEARADMLSNVKRVVTGEISAENAVKSALELN